MTWTRIILAALLTALTISPAPAADAKPSARDALKPFNLLIGTWRSTGTPEGNRDQIQKGFWTQSDTWSWRFKRDDAWLTATFDKGKYFTAAELRYLADKDAFQLTLTRRDKEKQAFVGKLQDDRLTLTRTDDKAKETQQLVLSLLHSNRVVYSYAVKPEGKRLYTRLYKVGCTKEGEEFAAGDGQPVCIVSGGLGKIVVRYKGQTYYVCCSGCADAFKDDPEKYIKEYEAKRNKK